MTAKNVVLKSINNQSGGLCVDVFQRPDGSFGFEEYRRDAEDNRGWFPIGGFHAQVFRIEGDAIEEARSAISWLGSVLKG